MLNPFEIVCETAELIEYNLSSCSAEAVIITTNPKVSDQLMVRDYGVELNSFTCGNIRIYKIWEKHERCVIRILINSVKATTNILYLQKIKDKLKKYNLNETVPIIFLKTTPIKKLEDNIKLVFENVNIYNNCR